MGSCILKVSMAIFETIDYGISSSISTMSEEWSCLSENDIPCPDNIVGYSDDELGNSQCNCVLHWCSSLVNP